MIHHRTEDAQFLGCVTDNLANGNKITIPVYANFCSGICYEKNDEKALARLHRCPHSGDKHDVDPVVQRLFK